MLFQEGTNKVSATPGRFSSRCFRQRCDMRRMFYCLWLTRTLERIGDHDKNLREQEFYCVDGLAVMHET